MIILVSFADFFLSFCVHVSLCLISFSFQELDLSPEALLRNESNREEPWTDLVESSLKMAGKFTQVSSCVYEATFEIFLLSPPLFLLLSLLPLFLFSLLSLLQICTVRLVGILLLVYVKEELVPHVSDICSDYVPCGIGGLIGHLVCAPIN